MEKIIFNKRVVQQLNEIVFILFNEKYFSFVETALEYRNDILSAITVSNLKRGKASPPKNVKLGNFYIKHKSNHHTTWYVFYDIIHEEFYIEHIINNHLPEARFLNLS